MCGWSEPIVRRRGDGEAPPTSLGPLRLLRSVCESVAEEATMDDVVNIERRDNVALITLNRPESLNAVNRALREALIVRLNEANADEALRAVVITGAGDRAFCSGQDLSESVQYTIADVDDWLTRQHAMYQALRALANPAWRPGTASPRERVTRSGSARTCASVIRR